MKTYDLTIVGAGPAGIMAAITAAKNGKMVLLIEKNDCIGRKILATGNGRCNLTNNNIETKRYHGATPKFIQTVLNNFDQHQTIEFFESLGVALKEEDRGRIFPRSNQASTIVEALKHLLEKYKVDVMTETTIKSIEKDDNFVIKSENGEQFLAKNLLLSTGGRAAFQFGSSGDGIFWAKKMGHSVIPIYPALVPIETEEAWVKDVQGIKVEANITSKINSKIIKESFGDCLFTHYGISGPAVMAQAGEISPLIETNHVTITLDLYPESSEAELDKKIEEIFKNHGKRNIANCLLGLFPAKLVPEILQLAKVNPHTNASEASKSDRLRIVKQIKNLVLTVKKLRPLKEAQVSRGGISTDEVNVNSLESKIIKGLYFAGEILDVDGDSGGFNLQWAWSSGFVAGNLQDN